MNLEETITAAWDDRADINTLTIGPVRDAVDQTLKGLDSGDLRVASKESGAWITHSWIKQAILLSFRLYSNAVVGGGPRDHLSGEAGWYDKVPTKFAGWTSAQFAAGGFRAVPGAIVRRGAYIAHDVVLMPSFVNIGAYVGEGTMVDIWATIASGAQIGSQCHISAGVVIGGVLEPLQATPTIIEDNCFIGVQSAVTEGVIVEEGTVLSMGVCLNASTKIVDRDSGEIFQGRVPAYSVVVPGTLPGKSLADGNPGPSLACAVIVKRVDQSTRAKTSINELLRA